MEPELTVEEAAALLGLSVAGVRRRIQRGDLKARRVGARLWLIPREEVERAQSAGKLKPGPKPRQAPAGEHEEGES